MVLQACILTCALRARIIAGVGEVSVSGAVLREGGGSPSLPATAAAAAAAAAAAVAAVDSRFSGGSIPGESMLFLVVLESTPGWSGFDGLQEKHSGRTGSVFHAATSRACSGCASTFFWRSVKKVLLGCALPQCFKVARTKQHRPPILGYKLVRNRRHFSTSVPSPSPLLW